MGRDPAQGRGIEAAQVERTSVEASTLGTAQLVPEEDVGLKGDLAKAPKEAAAEIPEVAISPAVPKAGEGGFQAGVNIIMFPRRNRVVTDNR